MNERAFIILCVLAEPPDHSSAATSPLTAKTVPDITVCSEDPLLYSESTVYKNLQELIDYGYVSYGVTRDRYYTYYITKAGLEFLQNI